MSTPDALPPCPNPECRHPTVFVIESSISAFCWSACGVRGPAAEYETAPPGTVDPVQWAVAEARRLWALLPRGERCKCGRLAEADGACPDCRIAMDLGRHDCPMSTSKSVDTGAPS